MGLFDRFKRKKNLEVYNEQDLNMLETFIADKLGDFPNVLHELVSTDIHLDIAMIPPSEDRDYYTLVTMGMGAHKMNIPSQLDGYFGYNELMILLPSNWNIKSDEEQWYWPIRLLKTLARLPITNDTWLGFGHTIDSQKQFDSTTELVGSMLIYPKSTEEEPMFVDLESRRVHFYQILPLYQSEMDYKIKDGAEGLLEKMKEDCPFVIEPKRKNYMSNES